MRSCGSTSVLSFPGELTSVVTQVAEAFIEGDKAGV